MCLFLHYFKYMYGGKNMISEKGGGKNMIFKVIYRPLGAGAGPSRRLRSKCPGFGRPHNTTSYPIKSLGFTKRDSTTAASDCSSVFSMVCRMTSLVSICSSGHCSLKRERENFVSSFGMYRYRECICKSTNKSKQCCKTGSVCNR